MLMLILFWFSQNYFVLRYNACFLVALSQLMERKPVWKKQPFGSNNREACPNTSKIFSYGIGEVPSINLSADIAFGDFKVHY